jgi:tetratricopeptide (TPR) repeat protein
VLREMNWASVACGATGLCLVLSLAGCRRSAQSHVERGDAYAAKGDTAAAILEYRNAAQKDPTFAPARSKLADTYARQGNGPAALAQYVRAADLLPGDTKAQLKAGSLLALSGQLQEARSRAEKVLARDPNNVDALVFRANVLSNLKDIDGALRDIQRALALDPRPMLYTNLGALQAAKGDVRAAEASLRRAVDVAPKLVDARAALAQFLAASGRSEEAEREFKTTLQYDAAHSFTNNWLADFYLGTGRPALAETHLKALADKDRTGQSAVRLADYYIRMQRPDDAIAVLKASAGRPESWATARTKWAEVLVSQGKKGEALRVIDEVVAKQTAAAPARVLRGKLLLEANRLDEALVEARSAVGVDPANGESHFLLGQVQEARRQLDAAAAAYGEALRINPRASAARARLAVIEMQRNNLPLATQLAEHAVVGRPNDFTARLVLARTLTMRGELARAAVLTDALVREAPNSAFVQNQAGLLASARGDRGAARAAFEKSLELDGSLLEPLTALVSFDLAEKQGARARARIEARLAGDKRNGGLLSLAGRTWLATGDPAKAEAFLRQAIQVDAADPDAYGQLAHLYISQKKLEEAVKALDTLAASQPKDVAPPTLAAMVLQSQGKEAEARSRYERIVDVNPRAAVASNNLAWLHASKNEQLDRALELAQAATASRPEDPEFNDTLAFVYLKKGLPDLALAPLKLAVAKQPENPAFLYHLGLAYAGAGNKRAAREAIEQALRLRPAFPQADEARRILQTLD